MHRKIITDEAILRAPNEDVKPEEVDELVEILEQSLAHSPNKGVGLAAPQIGINKRIAIVRIKTKDLDISFNLVNPVIVEKLNSFTHNEEGCLSIPNQRFDVKRYKEIFVKDDLRPAGMVLTGFEAVVVQHESDHLEGILVKDRGVGKHAIGRNDPCPCGKKINGKPIKWKKCHGR